MSGNKHKLQVLFALTILMITVSPLQSQTRISSPYSRYGIGDIQTGRFGHNLGLSGLSSGFRNNASVNYLNPASYTAFDTTSFVFDVGVNSFFSTQKTENLSDKYNYTTLGYLLFGFPVSKWWGNSFGLVPYSNVGYKITSSENLDSIGLTDYLYEGSGGINRFYWGNAFRPFKNLSLGANISLLFGSLDKIRTASFPDSANIYDVRIKNSTVAGGLMVDWGIQYTYPLKSGIDICAGATFNTSSKIRAKQNTLAQRFLTGNTGYEVIQDTVLNISDEKGKITIPTAIGAGLVITKKDKWLAGGDIKWQNWSDFNNFGEIDSLKNSLDGNIGFAIIPDLNATGSYFKKVQYRLGIHYGKSYLQLKNTQIQEIGFSLGFGFPLKRSKSSINIGIEIGQRGTTDNKLIREQYGKVTIGLSIFERWFLTNKYE